MNAVNPTTKYNGVVSFTAPFMEVNNMFFRRKLYKYINEQIEKEKEEYRKLFDRIGEVEEPWEKKGLRSLIDARAGRIDALETLKDDIFMFNKIK